jgi:uncharacterized protein YciW
MLAHVEKLTRHAYRVTPEDLDGLRAAGFDDQAILQITMIAAWFNYINRMADALGVGRDLPAAAEFVGEGDARVSEVKLALLAGVGCRG